MAAVDVHIEDRLLGVEALVTQCEAATRLGRGHLEIPFKPERAVRREWLAIPGLLLRLPALPAFHFDSPKGLELRIERVGPPVRTTERAWQTHVRPGALNRLYQPPFGGLHSPVTVQAHGLHGVRPLNMRTFLAPFHRVRQRRARGRTLREVQGVSEPSLGHRPHLLRPGILTRLASTIGGGQFLPFQGPVPHVHLVEGYVAVAR